MCRDYKGGSINGYMSVLRGKRAEHIALSQLEEIRPLDVDPGRSGGASDGVLGGRVTMGAESLEGRATQHLL